MAWSVNKPYSLARTLLLALNPGFARRTAVGLELDSDRIELVEQQRSTDPTLRHIALALRAGIQSALPLTACMERHQQPRSPFTSYANLARQCCGRRVFGLPPKRLLSPTRRAV
jgi:hypothetical protein